MYWIEAWASEKSLSNAIPSTIIDGRSINSTNAAAILSIDDLPKPRTRFPRDSKSKFRAVAMNLQFDHL